MWYRITYTMQGIKELVPKMMYQVHIDELVPQNNFYRLLEKSLDLQFLYKATKHYYGVEGQESIDPVWVMKIINKKQSSVKKNFEAGLS